MNFTDVVLYRSFQEKSFPEKIRGGLFWLFWCSIVLFPLGRAPQVAFPLVQIPFLLYLYWKDWNNCTLRKLPCAWCFIPLAFCVVLQQLLSHWPAQSWHSISPNLYRGFWLAFVGMECVRTEKDLRYLVVAFWITAFYQGIDGIWQYTTGKDWIRDTPMAGSRLTASFGTPRVGNYIGIIGIPALGIWYLLRTRNMSSKIIMMTLFMFPAFFLWIFAQARTGYIALLGALYVAYVFNWAKPTKRNIFIPLVLAIFAVLFGPERISLHRMMVDGRIDIWETAFKTILHSFWFGSGASTFANEYQALGFSIPEGVLDHPHNIYLQFWVDGGLVSFVGILIFLLGMLLWPLPRIRQGVKAEQRGELSGHFWRLTAFFWAAWLAYLITGVSGHDFYRTWWISVAMTMLGIMLGAYGNGTLQRESPAQHDQPCGAQAE